MAMRREAEVQGDLVVTWAEMPRSPGHAFYDRLQKVLTEAGFDAFVETTCKPFYAPRMGAPSLPPGRYFRMHMIGYFEGIDSERGIAWRCSDSLSLREFLRLASRDKVADHSWLSKTRSRLPHEVHEKIFGWVLALVAERGLVKGERIGVDGSTMEANAALRTIVRRENGETYRQMLIRMAQESGVATPTIDDLVRLDRARKGAVEVDLLALRDQPADGRPALALRACRHRLAPERTRKDRSNAVAAVAARTSPCRLSLV